jgi:phosphoglycerate dehydrogenase-like enzyme
VSERGWRVTVPDDRWSDLWTDRPDGQPAGLDLVVWDLVGPVPPDADGRPRADVVVAPYMGALEVIARVAEVEGLRLVQTLTAGYDGMPERIPAGVELAIATGVHDASTAELAVGLTLASLRGLGQAAVDATTGTWRHRTLPSLADRRVLLLGVGSVGAAIADRLAPFEVALTRVGNTARDDAGGHVHGTAELPDLLPEHDVVILVTPLTESTRGLVGKQFLAAMPDGALLVNVARGPVVQTDALLAELTTGRLHAALDVTDPEPLPADHPLWTAPNLLISPHVGGDTTAFPTRARALLRDQLERLADGRPLRNLVRQG